MVSILASLLLHPSDDKKKKKKKNLAGHSRIPVDVIAALQGLFISLIASE